MKKISKIFYLLAGGLFLLGINSCKKDYLNVDHYSVIDIAQGFNSDAAAKSSIIGCYTMMLPTSID